MYGNLGCPKGERLPIKRIRTSSYEMFGFDFIDNFLFSPILTWSKDILVVIFIKNKGGLDYAKEKNMDTCSIDMLFKLIVYDV